MYYIFREGVCSLRCPACNGHAPHYNFICNLSGSIIFSTLFKKRHYFVKNFIEHKVMF